MTSTTPSPTLSAFEREADVLLSSFQERLQTRIEEVFQHILTHQASQFGQALEKIIHQSLGNALGSVSASTGGFQPSAAQQGVDLLAALEKAKRNL